MQNGVLKFLTATTVKNLNLNFKNPRWRTAAILKTVNYNISANVRPFWGEIWHGDAYN